MNLVGKKIELAAAAWKDTLGFRVATEKWDRFPGVTTPHESVSSPARSHNFLMEVLMSHYWGDGFKYFGEVGEAAAEIGQFCRRWGRISVTQTKEKYGTARVYCHFGWYQLFSITHPGYVCSRYPQWLWSLDCHYISNLFRLSRVNRLVLSYQTFIYRLAYKRALKKYPFIRDEILGGADYSECLEGL